MSIFLLQFYRNILTILLVVAGILLVTGVGVALGVSVGVIVLFTVLFCFRRSVSTHTVLTKSL